MKRRRTKQITTKISPAVEALIDELATGQFGFCRSKRRWIVATALEEAIIAMVDWKRRHPLIQGCPFRMIAEEAQRFPGTELCEQAEAEAESDVIDALLAAATKEYERMKQEDAEP